MTKIVSADMSSEWYLFDGQTREQLAHAYRAAGTSVGSLLPGFMHTGKFDQSAYEKDSFRYTMDQINAVMKDDRKQ